MKNERKQEKVKSELKIVHKWQLKKYQGEETKLNFFP